MQNNFYLYYFYSYLLKPCTVECWSWGAQKWQTPPVLCWQHPIGTRRLLKSDLLKFASSGTEFVIFLQLLNDSDFSVFSQVIFFFVILFTEISSSLIWIFSVWQQQKYPDQNSALKFYPKKHQNQQKNSAKIRGEREAKKPWSSLSKNKYFPLSNSNYVSKIKIKALKVLLLHVGHVLLQHFLWYRQQMLCPTPKAALIILNSYFPPKSRLEMKYFNYTLLI